MTQHFNVLRGSYHNILAEYDSAPMDAHKAGWTWYSDMREWCATIGRKYDVSTERCIAAFAALSPMNTVDQCKQALTEVLDYGTTDLNWPANVSKAQAIIQYGIYEVLSGQKVVAFEQAIDKPLGDSAPVIDRHAVSVYMGRHISDIERKGLERKRVHARISHAYRKAARVRKLPVHVMQAIVWQSYRDREVSV